MRVELYDCSRSKEIGHELFSGLPVWMTRPWEWGSSNTVQSRFLEPFFFPLDILFSYFTPNFSNFPSSLTNFCFSWRLEKMGFCWSWETITCSYYMYMYEDYMHLEIQRDSLRYPTIVHTLKHLIRHTYIQAKLKVSIRAVCDKCRLQTGKMQTADCQNADCRLAKFPLQTGKMQTADSQIADYNG